MRDAVSIINTGLALATSATSAGGTLPLNSAGGVPRRIRIVATAAAYVRIGTGAQTAIATDALVQPGDQLYLDTCGHTHVAALQVAAAGVVQVSALES